MNRETEQHFSEVPYIDKPRSKFKRPYNHKTTFNTGELIPIYLDQDILPGDTVKIDMSMVVRMATPLYPVMDNAFIDIYFFFCPNRLIWNHWREFWGENTNAWYQTVEYEIPQIKTASGGGWFSPKSVGDYFGLPTAKAGLSVSALPFRAYVKCWNDWFRDENLQQEAANTTTDYSYNAVSDGDAMLYAYRGGKPLKVNKFHDYFSSALPAPQKGNEVLLPIGTWAPVVTRTELIETSNTGSRVMEDALRWGTYGNYINPNHTIRTNYQNTTLDSLSYIDNGETLSNTGSSSPVFPNNLWTDLTNATAATITQLRQAFAVQRFFEAQARGGWEKSA